MSNFSGCGRNVVCVPVDDSPRRFLQTYEAAVQRAAVGTERLGNTAEADVLAKTAQYFIEKGDFDIIYDPKAGLTSAHVDRALDGMAAHDVVVLDFDRTLSVVEGFVFECRTWEDYLLGAQHFLGVAHSATVDNLISAQLGGAERAAWVAHSLERFVSRVGADNVFVLTNNRNVHLIAAVMQWLAVRGHSPAVEADHVISTHYTGLRSKAEVIRTLTESSDDGYVADALKIWHSCASNAWSSDG